jgi:hypothetical protein
MTECSLERVEFTRIFGRRVVADFAGGRISSDAGGLLLAEADRRMGLTAALATCVADSREAAKVEHPVEQMIRQRVYGLALGYEDLNDWDRLRQDPLWQMLAGKDGQLASSPTLCRFENGVERKALLAMSEVLVERFISGHRKPPKKVVLDFDATDDPVYGGQEKRFFHGYYDSYCYLPLYVFCGKHLLVALLRPSNIDPARGSRAVLKMLVERLRRAWPKVQIVLRADSGFCRWRTMRWCDGHGVGYILGLAKNSRLDGLSGKLQRRAERQYGQSGRKQRLFGEFRYAAYTWDRPRRVIARVEHSAKGPNPRYVVTSLDGQAAELYDDGYCPRGEMENRIKEQQLDLFAGRTSAHRFQVNQLRLLLAAAAYVLVDYIRRHALSDTELQSAQCGTIRLKLFKIGARIVRSVRRIVLHLSSGYPYARLFCHAAERLVPV